MNFSEEETEKDITDDEEVELKWKVESIFLFDDCGDICGKENEGYEDCFFPLLSDYCQAKTNDHHTF